MSIYLSSVGSSNMNILYGCKISGSSGTDKVGLDKEELKSIIDDTQPILKPHEFNIRAIGQIFANNFTIALRALEPKSGDVHGTMIKECVLDRKKSIKSTKSDNLKIIFNISEINIAVHKDTLKRCVSIGFFHFNIERVRSNLIMSYFSDISIEDSFQKRGLFKVIFTAYDLTIRQLQVDLDYLHVVSNVASVASLYYGYGYRFTPEAQKLITEKYEGEEKYLQNSSVSYLKEGTIEMFRAIGKNAPLVERSIEILKQINTTTDN